MTVLPVFFVFLETCAIGTVTESCSNGECVCKPEYKPPVCCECADGYYEDENGVCQRKIEFIAQNTYNYDVVWCSYCIVFSRVSYIPVHHNEE